VREEYGRLYGPRFEAKFSAPASTKLHVAKQLFGEWLAEVEGRIAATRAQRKGEGRSLTPRQARALAGEWYDWFIARHPVSDRQTWENLRDQVQGALREAVGDEQWEQNNPDDLWRDDEELRKAVRPVLADLGETAQFLGMKGMALDNEARDRFLKVLYDDLSAVLHRLIRISDNDYSADKYRERFPKFEGADTGETPWQLFEKWVSERKPATSSIESWRYVFGPMTEHFKDRSAASITPDEAQHWIKSLINPSRSARTVDTNWITASKTVFGWAAEHKHIPRNSFADVKVTVPKRTKLRETQAFRPHESQTILKAALEVSDSKTADGAARRWVPWLCAYTGARVGEITQLRKEDVSEPGGIPELRITPAAGTVKSGRARVVPLHEHLIEQGFLAFVAGHGNGPLFYKPDTKDAGRGTKQRKPRAAQLRQRLAAWVRSLGITDPELQPNHAWRHTFKQIADHVGITERTSNYITGHAHKNVGATYGAPTLAHMADAMKMFPRYAV
jgi:integrase